jgi:hypothetical protein
MARADRIVITLVRVRGIWTGVGSMAGRVYATATSHDRLEVLEQLWRPVTA